MSAPAHPAAGRGQAPPVSGGRRARGSARRSLALTLHAKPVARARNAVTGEPEASVARLSDSKEWTPSGCRRWNLWVALERGRPGRGCQPRRWLEHRRQGGNGSIRIQAPVKDNGDDLACQISVKGTIRQPAQQHPALEVGSPTVSGSSPVAGRNAHAVGGGDQRRRRGLGGDDDALLPVTSSLPSFVSALHT